MTEKQVIAAIQEQFRIDTGTVSEIADAFSLEMQRVSKGHSSSLHMLPSFLSPPSGMEKGRYIAIDFGGSNIRVMEVMLLGQGKYQVIDQVSKPLRDPEGRYDLTTASATGDELFGFVGALAAQLVRDKSPFRPGLTFSYPMDQESLCKARLLRWTKEIKAQNTIGKDIGQMLCSGLRRHGLQVTEPVPILNDTVATFLTGCYQETAVCAGSICGTGHNTCYLETERKTLAGRAMILDLEAGNFSHLKSNHYDCILDHNTEDPGRQRLEKMAAGKYLGELFRLVMQDMVRKGLFSGALKAEAAWNQPYSIGSEVLGWLQARGKGEQRKLQTWMKQQGMSIHSEKELSLLRDISAAILDRAMKLIAATYIALLERTPSDRPQRRVIAVDGAIFHHMPGFIKGVEQIVSKFLPQYTIALLPVHQGSSIGAAVAAALAGNSEPTIP